MWTSTPGPITGWSSQTSRPRSGARALSTRAGSSLPGGQASTRHPRGERPTAARGFSPRRSERRQCERHVVSSRLLLHRDGVHFTLQNGWWNHKPISNQLGDGWGGGEGTLFVDPDTQEGYVIFGASATNSRWVRPPSRSISSWHILAGEAAASSTIPAHPCDVPIRCARYGSLLRVQLHR